MDTRGKPWEDRGRDLSGVSISQGTPRQPRGPGGRAEQVLSELLQDPSGRVILETKVEVKTFE